MLILRWFSAILNINLDCKAIDEYLEVGTKYDANPGDNRRKVISDAHCGVGTGGCPAGMLLVSTFKKAELLSPFSFPTPFPDPSSES